MANIHPPEAGLLRLSEAARIVGVTSRVLITALVDREIPISIVRLGSIYYVRTAELNQWLRSPHVSAPAPDAVDLFQV